MSLTGKTLASTYKSILRVNDNTNGIDTSLEAITDGEGTSSMMSLSTRQVAFTPDTDTTTVISVKDKDSNALLTVDSTNDVVKLGIGQHYANTAIKDYFIGSGGAFPATTDTWTALGQGSGGRTATPSIVEFGTGSTPQTSYTISTTADDIVSAFWYLPFNITIDMCWIWFGADASSGDDVKFSVMSYTVDSGNGSTGGDLSGGVENCVSPATITGAGYEQAYRQALTVSTANVDAGKMIGAFVHQDGTNADLSVQLQLVYHLR
jgi:hypothetical protein